MNKKVDDFLTHYGVLGMKWGRRKSSGSGSTGTTAKPAGNKSEDYKTAKGLQRKKLSDMSNKEIETLTKRLQLETSYRRLTAPTKSKGKQFVETALSNVGKKVASEFNKQFIEPRIEQLMTKLIARATRPR